MDNQIWTKLHLIIDKDSVLNIILKVWINVGGKIAEKSMKEIQTIIYLTFYNHILENKLFLK